MITSSDILIYLSEVWDSSAFNRWGKRFDIYANPSGKDFREIGEADVRFCADSSTKTIYVWDYLGNLHHEVRAKLNLKCTGFALHDGGKWCTSILDGLASREGHRYIMNGSDMLKWAVNNTQVLDDILSRDWSWMDRYIISTPFINKFRDILDKHRDDVWMRLDATRKLPKPVRFTGLKS